jgi:hypothetical protein
MSEEETGTVPLTFNPGNLFPQVFRWMYTNELTIDGTTFIPILSMAYFYEINDLIRRLTDFYRANVEPHPPLVRQCLQQCYDLEIPMIPECLIATLAKSLGEPGFEIETLSRELTVAAFCEVITGFEGSLEEKVRAVTQFLGGYELHPGDQEMLHCIFTGREQAEIEAALTECPVWVRLDLIGV